MIFDFKKGFNNTNSLTHRKRAIIAISANIMDENSALHFAYSESIVEAGGVPVIIPANCDADTITSLIGGIDGLLLSGGDDIDARYFGEENIPNLTTLNLQRDLYEFMLLRAAIDCGVPILGICRGCQVINIALGGSIYQDLPSMYEQELLTHSVLTNKHLPVHDIEIAQGSLLHSIVGEDRIGVNSRHHQAIKDLAPTLKVSARSKDGVIEAIEGYPKIIALQCHPENLATKGESAAMKRLFSHLISEAELYRQAKEIHTLHPIIDSHCDTPMLYEEGGFDLSMRNHTAQVDIVKMGEGYLDATITVAYISQSTPKQEATQKAISILRRFKSDLSTHSQQIICAYSPDEVIQAKRGGLKSVMLGVENGLAIGDDLSNVDLFKSEGVTYITLCHNGSNDICDSAVGDAIHSGLSEFGKRVIERMNRVGITVDISHSSEQSTLDAMRLSSQPIIASHSSCKSLCDHPRNLSDDTIKRLAASGGVIQICGYGGFLTSNEKATIHDMIAHIEHVVSLVGDDYVGVGSDFDGGGGVEGFEGANHFMNITIELLRRGHSTERVAKIMGGNILRVLSKNYKQL